MIEQNICTEFGRCAYDLVDDEGIDIPCPWWNDCFGVALAAVPAAEGMP